MAYDPFAHVRDERSLARLWRELARRHHPDANPDDPRAEENFKRLEGLRRRALARLRGLPWKAKRSAPPPAPLRCVGCGDGFTIGHECPRCALPLRPREDDAAAPLDPRVEALIESLEAPRPEPIFELAPEARLPLFAMALFALGLLQWRFGLLGLSVLSVAFAFVAVGTMVWERRRPSWMQRF
ncbi:MAG: hypothetical protein H6722_24665 [Sandaracinus sp.]|nr:hypothetical protein [Sandaracinus sp.]MCB9604847.1 hypothetical protein [Sandaracinus sp.]MCB9615638.1 hypothetical protein [Sandaracinus sp.]MCB9618727.1 hypothetical protein [Sandaracinus sp.]